MWPQCYLTLKILCIITCSSRQLQKSAIGNEEPNLMKSCSLDNLKISKAEYGKTDKETPKPTAFDPRSTELAFVSFMEQLKAGLQQHASSAVFFKYFHGYLWK